MILNYGQEQALKIAIKRYKDKELYTCISGPAGSGKSTLIKFIIAALNLNEEEVAYATFTGKAAQVLKNKGCKNAITLHKLLYKAFPNKDGTFSFVPKETLDEDYKLVVIDEISMVSKTLWDLLLTHRIHILCLGDEAQLPPIISDEDNHILDKPHYHLTEILRQAQESEIIRLATHIREGKSINSFQASNQQVMILNRGQLTEGHYLWADQILCAKNDTRNSLNLQMRNILKYPEEPTINDKIISLRNHWDEVSNLENPLTNGCIGVLSEYEKKQIWLPQYIYKEPLTILVANFNIDDLESFNSITIDYNQLLTGNKTITSRQEYLMNKNKQCPNAPYDFAYAYAITVWKAQGSEFGKVLLFEENFPFDRLEHQKYLYTGVTRASEKLVLVR